MIKFIAKLITNFIPNRKSRRKARRWILTQFYARDIFKRAKYVGKNLICGDYCFVSNGTIIGDNVRLNQVKIIGNSPCIIGNNCQFGTEIMILTSNHNYDKAACLPFDNTYCNKSVKIDDYVWVGSRVTILPGTHIGEGCVIQAGSVVHGEIPPCAIIGGNPAKVFKYRDIEHFNKLKADNKVLIEF